MRVSWTLVFILAIAGCAGAGPLRGGGGEETAKEIIRLKMAVQGKRPDGTPLKPEDDDYISPEQAQRRLSELLEHYSMVRARPIERAGGQDGEGNEGEGVRLPPVLGTGEAFVKGMLRNSRGKVLPCRVMVEATGVPLDYWGGGLGKAFSGAFSMVVPCGVVDVRAACGVFRPTVERNVPVSPGKELRLEHKFSEKVDIPERLGVEPVRLVFLTEGLRGDEGKRWRERVALLEKVEGVDLVSVAGPDEAIPAGKLEADFMPPWPGYGKFLVLGRAEALDEMKKEWRASGGGEVCGGFVGRKEVMLAACLVGEEGLFPPEDVYSSWPLLRRVFGNAGVFDAGRPSELPFLVLSGKVRHVLFPVEELPGRFLGLLDLSLGVLPLLRPEPWEMWPDVLVPRGEAPLAAIRKGRYSIGNGLYVWASIGGRPPGGVVEPGSVSLEVWAFTAALRDAGIKKVEVYYNGRLMERAEGAPNQVVLTMKGNVFFPGPGWVVVSAEGEAREDAQRRRGLVSLRAVSAPIFVGGGPAPIESRLLVRLPDGAGEEGGGVVFFRNGAPAEAEKTGNGMWRVKALWGDDLEAVSGGRRLPLRPWLRKEVNRLLRVGQCGSPSVWTREYWEAAASMLSSGVIEPPSLPERPK